MPSLCFKSAEWEKLHAQLMLSPAEVRRRYADRLEELIAALELDRQYPYEFLYFRITGFRLEEDPGKTFLGRDALPDLQRLLEALSASAPIPTAKVPEPVYDLRALCRTYRVSWRTVHRWRRRGLIARKYAFPDGRVLLGVRRSVAERFAKGSSGPLRRLSPSEQSLIVSRMQQMIQEHGLSRTAAARMVAAEVGRSPETVRLLLKRAASAASLAACLAPEEARRRIWQDYLAGVRPGELQKRYALSRASIYRILNQQKALELMSAPVHHVADPALAEMAESEVLGSALDDLLRRIRQAAQAPHAPRPPWEPVLKKADETALFRAFNYAKFRIAQCQKELNPKRYVSSATLRAAARFASLEKELRREIEQLYMPLVELAAAQHATDRVPAAELASQGRATLRQLVDSFDYRGRGLFSSYLKLELLKRFARALAPSQ